MSDQPILDPAGLTGVSRRNFLRYSAALGAGAAAAAALAACGGPASTTPGGGASGTGTSASGGSTGGTQPSGSAAPASGAGGGSGKPAGTITATLAFTLSSGFDPMNASSAVALCTNPQVFEGLINLDPISREPYLALAKEQPKPSADGLTWTVTVVDDAKFSDGTPVTAEDVAWSFTRILDPANNAIIAQFIPFIDTATATDAHTVEFKLKNPFPLFANRIPVVQVVPKAKTATADLAKAFDTAPIGSGPFTIASASQTAGVTMAANPHYTRSRPPLVEKIVYHTTTDNQARLNDLLGGTSQAIEAVPYLDVPTVKGKFEVSDKSSFNCLFLMFNCAAKPFDDKRVRQALFYAIDTDKVIKTALSGFGTAATSYLNEGSPYYQKASTVYSYDPDKAKGLLKDAGVTDLSFTLVTTNTGFIADSAPLIIQDWQKIGVKATLNTNPSSAVYGTIVPADSFRVLAASGDPSVFAPDADLMLRWFYYGKTWPVARERWTDAAAKQCETLIDKAAQASGDEQKQLWKQVFDLVAAEVPLYPVFHTKSVDAWDGNKLTNFKGSPSTGLSFLGVGVKA